MSRHPDPDTLDPAAAAELAALEAALAGDAPADPEWAALVAAIREDAPAPRASFQCTLDERVAAGFPRSRPGWLRLPARRVLPALAVASTLLVGGVVVGAGTGVLGGDSPSTGFDGSAIPEAAPSDDAAAAGAASGAGTESAPAAPRPPVAARKAAPARAAPGPSRSSDAASQAVTPVPSAPARSSLRPGSKVERTTTLALTTDARGLQEAANGIVRATQELGGVVSTSQVDTSPEGGEATFVLRIPTDRLDDALKRFGTLADVARLTQGSEDITGAFVSAQDRLSDARAERKALLAALGKASTPRSIAGLRARIRGNRTEIARLEGDLRGLRRRADLARVDVTLSASGAAADPGAGGAWGPGDAAGDALRVLEVLAGVALVAGAVLLPLGLLGGGAAVAGRGVRRRRREAALGGG